MKELNRHILLKAIELLPEYEPGDSIWNYIKDRMDNEFEDKCLREGLQTLPVYDPPKKVWEHIKINLAKGDIPIVKMVPLRPWRRLASIAAAIVILILGSWWFLNPKVHKDGRIAFSKETIDDQLLKHDWEVDDRAYEDLMTLCKTKISICRQPDFQILQSELGELNDAKEALNMAIGKFGTSPDLITQMKDIEMERTKTMKAMLEKLI